MPPRGSLTAEEIGSLLRAARTEQGYATEEVAWRLKVRPELIRTLERRDPTALPQPALVRNSLASYVRFLGLDEDEILAAFDAEADFVPPMEELQAQARNERRPPRARWILAAAFSLMALGAAAVAGFLGAETDPVPQAQPSASESVEPVTEDEASITLTVTTKRPARMSVTADGVQVFDGTLLAENEQRFSARAELGIVAADGAALAMSVNGRPVDTRGPGVFSATFGPGGRRL